MTKLQFLKELQVLNTTCVNLENNNNEDIESLVNNLDYMFSYYAQIIYCFKKYGVETLSYNNGYVKLIAPEIFKTTKEISHRISKRFYNQIQNVCNELKIIPSFNTNIIDNIANTINAFIVEDEILQDIVNCLVSRTPVHIGFGAVMDQPKYFFCDFQVSNNIFTIKDTYRNWEKKI